MIQNLPEPTGFSVYLDFVTKHAWMLSVVSIFLVFIGWKVTYYNSSKLATRSESKALIDSFTKLINEIADAAIEFWLHKSQVDNIRTIQKAGCAQGIKLRIKHDNTKSDQFVNIVLAKTRLVYRYMDMLRERDVVIAQPLIGFLVEKSTLQCEFAGKMSSSDRTIRAQEIIDSAIAIIGEAYTSFQVTHPPSKPFQIRKSIKVFFDRVEKWHDTF